MTVTRTSGPGLRRTGVESARARLVQQRAFRVKQLAELVDGGRAGAGPTEIRVALREGAEAALADVEAALRRIEQGTYGRCLSCGNPVSRPRLEAVPSAPLCWACHRARDTWRQAALV
jgi:DnaK suppressor protein